MTVELRLTLLVEPWRTLHTVSFQKIDLSFVAFFPDAYLMSPWSKRCSPNPKPNPTLTLTLTNSKPYLQVRFDVNPRTPMLPTLTSVLTLPTQPQVDQMFVPQKAAGVWVCVLLQLLASARAYSSGQVTEVCGSMVPQHGGSANTTHSPYSLALNSTIFRPGGHIAVTLSGTSDFEGFLLQARDAANQNAGAVGSFTLTNPKLSQLLTCDHIQGSAVSHTSDALKREVRVVWNAPMDAPDIIQFLVTVVAKYRVYWVKLPGPIISQSGVTPLPPRPTPTPSSPPPTTPSVLPGPFSSEGCGQSKSCLQDPAGCDPEVDPLCYFLSWSPRGQGVEFELSGPTEGYVTFALSRDTWMGDDDVYLCVRDRGVVYVNAAYVTGRTSPVDSSENVLTGVSWRAADGVLQCGFRRPVQVPQDPERFSLDLQHYVFLANGEAEDGQSLHSHQCLISQANDFTSCDVSQEPCRVRRHTRQPLISSQKVSMTGLPQVLSGSRSPTIMKFHGVLMLLAWMLAGSTGTFLASYYREAWPGHTLLGQRPWFQFHRGLMVLTVLLTSVAFTLPFIYRGGWSKRAGVHPYLGCCVMALTILQPIMAGLRPSPDSPRRWAFNWLHWGAGSVAEIMAGSSSLSINEAASKHRLMNSTGFCLTNGRPVAGIPASRWLPWPPWFWATLASWWLCSPASPPSEETHRGSSGTFRLVLEH
ncbi:putative ferric-chelate reductase 1 isoform X2 [Hypomesus transpacificus]|uniref:putative ferric-chelate reductase 1 isoform X2 n=1 Tax=Hypomesus transpacificus TaxID=137520 RepID=UPI001F081AD8|nr:putative ferric-chelate reductase 1 isoform X2 [Hypomesus transpacificus]XP_046883335.1 putative ferric-chelate reductase 1 isoform X2 [Hypomesus transpacificus]